MTYSLITDIPVCALLVLLESAKLLSLGFGFPSVLPFLFRPLLQTHSPGWVLSPPTPPQPPTPSRGFRAVLAPSSSRAALPAQAPRASPRAKLFLEQTRMPSVMGAFVYTSCHEALAFFSFHSWKREGSIRRCSPLKATGQKGSR